MEDAPAFGRVIAIDIRGQVCPASLLITLRKINEIKDDIQKCGARLEVLTDNRDSVGTISEAAFNMGYGVGTEKQDGHYRMVISAAG